MIKVYLTWHDFGVGVDILIDKIKQDKIKYDGVFGIPRGGLIFALIISHRLHLPILLHPTKDTLIVDDISDTGQTLKMFKGKRIATLYSTSWTKSPPNYHVWDKSSKKEWITFPWESMDE